MEINKDKYLKELKKLGLDDLKAKSFLYDLERDLSITKRGKELDQELGQAKKKSKRRRAILYSFMVLIMIIYLVWIFSNSPEQGAEVITNVTKNVTGNVTNVINDTLLVNQTTLVN